MSNDSKLLEDLAARLARAVPASIAGLRGELEENFRAVLRGRLERLDLVSREHFEVQAELLRRTQKRLADLEKRLAAIERNAEEEPAKKTG
jgi:BMFP domain-containing protein YqiC